MSSLCCVPKRGLLCDSLNSDKVKLNVRSGEQWYLPDSSSMKNVELHLDGWMLAGCKCIVKKYCLMNKEKARSGLCLPYTRIMLSRE